LEPKKEADTARNEKGLLVKREDAWLATRKSGFDSPAVHSSALAS
jgi:hypothetical protein